MEMSVSSKLTRGIQSIPPTTEVVHPHEKQLIIADDPLPMRFNEAMADSNKEPEGRA